MEKSSEQGRQAFEHLSSSMKLTSACGILEVIKISDDDPSYSVEMNSILSSVNVSRNAIKLSSADPRHDRKSIDSLINDFSTPSLPTNVCMKIKKRTSRTSM